jgi:ATP-dependent Lon protease
VKEKLLAAHRAGIKVFLMPKKNKKDLVDVPQEVVDTVDIRLMETIDEVLKNALLPGPNVTPAQIEAARPSIPAAAPAH